MVSRAITQMNRLNDLRENSRTEGDILLDEYDIIINLSMLQIYDGV